MHLENFRSFSFDTFVLNMIYLLCKNLQNLITMVTPVLFTTGSRTLKYTTRSQNFSCLLLWGVTVTSRESIMKI